MYQKFIVNIITSDIIFFFVRHCQNLRIVLSKQNAKLILKILSDLEPLRGSSNKNTLYSTRSCVNWAFFGTRGPLNWPTQAKKGPIYTQTR
jgi:hypothetical protein